MSDRTPATRPFVPALEWYYEVPGVQESLESDLKADIPEMILVGNFAEEGLASYRPDLIMEFIDENYVFVEELEGASIYKPK